MTTEIKKIRKDAYDQEELVIVPPVDIYETDNEYVLKADMPGIGKEQLEITLENNELTINGRIEDGAGDEHLKYREYSLHNYYRNFKVGNEINTTAVTADLVDGVLTLVLPKRDEVKPRRIEIRAE